MLNKETQSEKKKEKNINKIPSRLSWSQLVFPSSQCQLNGHNI